MSHQHSRISRIQSRRGAPRSRQRGVAAIIIAGVLTALVTLMALAIDVGRLYYAQRQLETITTLAALDAARVASGCATDTNGTAGDGVPSADNAAAILEAMASVARNNTTALALDTPQVELGYTSDSISDSTNTSGRRRFKASDATHQSDSVRVTLGAAQPTVLFSAIFGNATGKLYASATARQAAIGTFNVGNDLLSVSGGALNQVLGALLCAPNDLACQQNVINLDLASSRNGLAAVTVSLGQLAPALGVNVSDLTNPLVLSSNSPPLNVVLTTLSEQIGGSASSLLRNLAAASTNPNGVPRGQLLGAVDSVAAAVPFVNLLDLILQLGEAATASPDGSVVPIRLGPQVSVPGVGTLNTFLQIGQPPQPARGRAGTAEAHTAEVTLMTRISAGPILTGLTSALSGAVNLLGKLLLGLVNISVVPGPLNIGLDVTVNPASARLTRLQCPIAAINNGLPVAGLRGDTGLATIRLGTFAGDGSTAAPISETGSIPLATVQVNGGLLGSTTLSVALGLNGADAGSGGRQLNNIVLWTPVTVQPDGSALPPGTLRSYVANGANGAPVADNPQSVSSATTLSVSVSPLTSQTGGGLVGGLSGLISNLLNAVTTALTPLVNFVSTILVSQIDPLLQALGVTDGSAQVTMISAQVDQPEIISTCLPGNTGPNC